MLLFAIPKPFEGHIGVIQRNAIGSWARLGRGTRVVLFGDETGTAAAADELGVEHVADVERNEHGTPLLSSLFAGARRVAGGEPLCFINSDVVLLDDFLPAVDRVRSSAPAFLMVGECWDLEVTEAVDFDAPDWRERLRADAVESGSLRGQWAIDWFAFSPDLYEEVPPFAIGRARYDNWLVWKARSSGVPVVDASRVVTAVHQEHGYAHVDGGFEGTHEGPEAVRNRELAGGGDNLYSIEHASHLLTPTRLRRRLQRPEWVRTSLAATQSVRHRVGLRPATTVRRLRSRLAVSRTRQSG